MARVVVDVMPKPEILDPQGKAVTGALARLGFAGMSVRQGKRFELELDGEVTDERLAEVRRAAETLLANTVIETFDVRVEPTSAPAAEANPAGNDHTENNAAEDNQAEGNQAKDNQAKDNQAKDNQAKDSQAKDSQARDDEAEPEEEAELTAQAG